MKKNLIHLLSLCFIGAHSVKAADDYGWHNPNRDIETVIAHVTEKGEFPEGFDPFNCSFTTSRSFSGLFYHAKNDAERKAIFAALMAKVPNDSQMADKLNTQSSPDSETALDELLLKMTTNNRVDELKVIFDALVLRGARLTKKTADFYRASMPFHIPLPELVELGVPADALWQKAYEEFQTSSRSWFSEIPKSYQQNIQDLLSLLPSSSLESKSNLLVLIADYSSASWLEKAMPLAQQILLDTEIDPDAKNYALTLAASKNQSAALTELLVQRGARVTPAERDKIPTLHNALKNTLDQGERTRKLTALLNAGANINEKDTSYFNTTPLMWARTAADVEFIRNAHTAFAGVKPVDLDAVDERGRTALFWALHQGRMDAIKALIAAGADKEKGRYEGKTALEFGRELFRKHNNKEAYQELENLWGVAPTSATIEWRLPQAQEPATPTAPSKPKAGPTPSRPEENEPQPNPSTTKKDKKALTDTSISAKALRRTILQGQIVLGSITATTIGYVVYCRAKWNSLEAQEKELYENSFIKFCFGKKRTPNTEE